MLVRARGPLRRILAALAQRLVGRRAFEPLGYARLEDDARERLGVSARSVQELAKVDLRLDSQAALPVAAIGGSNDIFAPRSAMAPIVRGQHAGLRKVVEVSGGTHVDAVVGDHMPETVDSLWGFLTEGAA